VCTLSPISQLVGVYLVSASKFELMTYFFSAMVTVVFAEIGLCDVIYYHEYNKQAPHNGTAFN
jgi:hypothetical protein